MKQVTDLCAPGKLLNKRYRVIEGCGEGSFGRVLHCVDAVSSRHVAIKVLQVRTRAQVDSLRREGQLLKDIEYAETRGRELVSSGCVRAHSIFQERGMACLVMEKLGQSYVSILKQNKYVALPLGLVRSVCTQVLRSLSFLHRMGLAHLDVKPHNILAVQASEARVHAVCADGESRQLLLPVSSEVKLVDFGGSKYVADDSAGYSYTTEFRSPEVILDLDITTATDMWSFGCVLYQLYTGRLLFPSPVRGRKVSSVEHMTMMAHTLGAAYPRNVARAALRQSDYARACFHSSGHLRACAGDTVTADSVVPLRQRLSSPQQLPLLDLLLWCLQYNPAARPSAEQAMAHPFFSGRGQLHDGKLGALHQQHMQQQLAAAIAAEAEEEEEEKVCVTTSTSAEEAAATALPGSSTSSATATGSAPTVAPPSTPTISAATPPQSPDACGMNTAMSPPLTPVAEVGGEPAMRRESSLEDMVRSLHLAVTRVIPPVFSL